MNEGPRSTPGARHIDDRHSPSNRSRYFALDALRGLIMVLMALDHANYMIAKDTRRVSIGAGHSPYTQTP